MNRNDIKKLEQAPLFLEQLAEIYRMHVFLGDKEIISPLGSFRAPVETIDGDVLGIFSVMYQHEGNPYGFSYVGSHPLVNKPEIRLAAIGVKSGVASQLAYRRSDRYSQITFP